MKIKFSSVTEFLSELNEVHPDLPVRLTRQYRQTDYPFQLVSILATCVCNYNGKQLLVELCTPPYGQVWGPGFEDRDEAVHALLEKDMALIHEFARKRKINVRAGYYDDQD